MLIELAVFLSFLAPSQIPDLDILAQIESSNNPRAVSRAGALGLCQIMPGTWREFARKDERWYNPRDNRAVAQRYLQWIRTTLRKMGDPKWNHPSHTLAAYNGGITAFRKRGFNIHRMPAETRTFVKRYREQARSR